MIREWLILCRIQSVPVTIIILSIGYGIATGTLLNTEILVLYLVGALGHLGVYAHNDIADAQHDLEAGDIHKPIPAGEIDRLNALTVAAGLILFSLFIAGLFFPHAALSAYFLSVAIGVLYNERSKKDIWSGVYLSLWGVLMLLTGYWYGV